MATRQEILAEIQRRGGQASPSPAPVEAPSVTPSRAAIEAELQRRDPSLLDQVGGFLQKGADFAGGVLETEAAMASGMLAEPIAGIAGIIAGLNPGGKTGAEQVEATRSSMTYQPRTESGQNIMGTIGGLAENIPEIGKPMGDFVMEKTGKPWLATAAASAPTLLAELAGLGSLRGLRTGSRLLDNTGRPTKILRRELDRHGLNYDSLTPEAQSMIPAIADQSFISKAADISGPSEQALIQQIKSGGRDDALAGVRVVRDKVVPDIAGVEALKQGYAPGFVQSVKTATGETKRGMGKMLDISRRIKATERLSLDIRPGNIVGESVSKRIKFIRNKANLARDELNDIAKQSLPGRTINPSTVTEQLQKSLADLDIRSTDGPNGVPILDFKRSMISKDKSSQRAIKDAVDLLSEGGSVDALRAHKLKRQLDNIIDFKKKSSAGLGDEGRKVLIDLRKALNKSVRDVDPDYARVNDTLHASLTALDDFQAVAGTKMDIFGEGANSAIGQKMRGLMSNIQSRVPLENAVNGLDATALKLGAEFGDDIKDLTMFANALDARFGNVAKTGFSGQIEQSINRVFNQGLSQEIMGQAAGKVSQGVAKMRGVNEFNAFEAMKDLIGER